MILVDAFSKTYLAEDSTPFIYAMARDGFSAHIKPLFAFEGIEATIFTGMWPNVHDVWTEFRYIRGANHNRRASILANVTRIIDCLPDDTSRSMLRFAVERYLFSRTYKTPNLIPPPAMPYFEPSISRGITERNALDGVRTVFDLFRRKGLKFVFIEPWISGDSGVLNKVKRLAEQKQRFHFWYVKLNNLDHCGHRFGPIPSLFQDQLAKTDSHVEKVVTLLQKQNPELNVMILTDHGMSKVHGTVNILGGLKQLKSKIYQDYAAFVDSTMIRFWFFEEGARQEVCGFLSQMRSGHILNSKEKELLKIPSDPSYGEEIYALDEGFIFHPCFFHSRSPLKGMHGYAYPKTSEAVPMLIMNKEMKQISKFDGEINYTDIFSVLADSFCLESSENYSASG